jgi:hypothetical protein
MNGGGAGRGADLATSPRGPAALTVSASPGRPTDQVFRAVTMSDRLKRFFRLGGTGVSGFSREHLNRKGQAMMTNTTAIARAEREIALMQEYRTRLTADLVTGKLELREAAAQLPAPPTEPTAEEALKAAEGATDSIEEE